jgi:hypothetical protein
VRYAFPCLTPCVLAAPPATFGAYAFQFDPRAEDFSFAGELDPGGGGNT